MKINMGDLYEVDDNYGGTYPLDSIESSGDSSTPTEEEYDTFGQDMEQLISDKMDESCSI